MTLEEVYQYYGSAALAAKAVGVSRQAFYMWMKRGFIPKWQQEKFQLLTNGKLKAHYETVSELSTNQFFTLPRYRYYSDKLGMCEVKSLNFRANKSPRICYFSPINPQSLFSSFDTKNLMQATDLVDLDGNNLYEGDIIIAKNKELCFKNITLLKKFHAINEFLIVGNQFEGRKDGY